MMVRESHYLRRFGRKLIGYLMKLESLDCPMCGGSGEPHLSRFNESVYWKVQVVSVCAQGYGSGKI